MYDNMKINYNYSHLWWDAK